MYSVRFTGKDKEEMKIVFFGTSSFAIPCLESLEKSSHTLLAVVTQPDQVGERFLKRLPNPVKMWAFEKRIPLLQPATLSEPTLVRDLKESASDLFVVASYGKILPASLLSIPIHGGINVHPSLLPRYRGASPICWAILNGDRTTGVSVIRMVKEVDTGDILLQKEVEIGSREDALQLSERLSHLGGELLMETLAQIEKGTPVFAPQKGRASDAPRFKKEDGAIDWTKSAEALSRQIRALVPWPGSFSYLKGKRVLLWKADPEEGDSGGRPGEVVSLSKSGEFKVATGKGKLLLKELQLEGKERMKSREFLIGHPLVIGETFSCNPRDS